MREQRDCAVVVGLAGIDMDQFVQRGRSGHQIDQQDRADDQRDKQPFAQLFQVPGSLIATIQLYAAGLPQAILQCPVLIAPCVARFFQQVGGRICQRRLEKVKSAAARAD